MIGLLLAATVAGGPSPPGCVSREAASAVFAKYDETLLAAGWRRDKNDRIEIWGKDGGTWTIVRVPPGGWVCALTFGEALDVTPVGKPL